MTLEKQTYTPDDFIVGGQLQTARAYIKAGQEFPRLTPLMRDATDTHLLVKWDGTQGKAIALSARPASSPSSNELSAIYVGACFRINHVNWPASADSDEKRRAAFIGTSVSVDDE